MATTHTVTTHMATIRTGMMRMATMRMQPIIMRPPLRLRRPVRLGDGRYVAGDHRDTASIQGALVSGQRAAETVLRDLG